LNEIVARYLKAIGHPREVVSHPEARYFGGPIEERSLGRWAHRASAASVSTNGSAGHRQEPDPAFAAEKETTPVRLLSVFVMDTNEAALTIPFGD
jgi:hypothetical protein